jgi:hypothetical protein
MDGSEWGNHVVGAFAIWANISASEHSSPRT